MDMGNDVQLICQVRPDRPWRICIPNNMITDIGHPGIVGLYQTIATYFVHPFLKVHIEQVMKTCDRCLQAKLPGARYVKLLPRQATLVPWYEVAANLIGPWTLLVHGQEI
jgi:hypothetical protein